MENDYLVSKALRDISKGLPSALKTPEHILVHGVKTGKTFEATGVNLLSPKQLYVHNRLMAHEAGRNTANRMAGGSGAEFSGEWKNNSARPVSLKNYTYPEHPILEKIMPKKAKSLKQQKINDSLAFGRGSKTRANTKLSELQNGG